MVEKVVCGCVHTLALSTAGVLYAWGGNDSGQLGMANQRDGVSRPVKVTKCSLVIESKVMKISLAGVT